MRKKKRILSLFLAVMMVFLVFTEHTPFSFAEGGRDLTRKMEASDITIKFSDNSNELKPNINVVEKGDGSYGPGAAYPNFTIDVNFSKLSANSVAESERLRGGDYVLLEMPNELQLRDGTFADPSNPFELRDPIDSVVFATVKKHLDGGKQYLKVVFNDNVNGRQNVKATIKFESTVKILSDDPISFDFNIFDKQVTLKITVTRKPVYVGYILKKHIANDYQTVDKQFGMFKFTLLANRKQENMDTVTVRDQLENGSPENWFEFDSIGFDKNSFEIEVGNFSEDEERVIKNAGKKYYTTKDGDFSFDNGNIVITFDSTDPEHPKNFEVLIKKPGTMGYKISYGVKVPIDEIGRGFTFNNTASLLDEHRNEKLINDKIPGQKHSKEKRTMTFTASGTITSDIKGRISVLKVEDGTSSPVSGAEFSLYKVETGGTETLIETKTTDEKGKINFNQLDVGADKSNPITYRVKEISAPDDYVQPNPQDVVKEVKLYEKGSGTEQNINGAVKVINKRKTIDITVNKKWSDSSSQKKDVTFTLKRRVEGEEQSKALKVDQVGVHATKTLSVTENSVEFKGLYEYDGTGKKYIYTVEEEKVEGYKEVAPVDVGNTHEVIITNTPETPSVEPKGSIKITKVDADELTKGLKGATFKVTNPTISYEQSFTTADDGTVTVSGLAVGTYTVKETEAPANYQLDTIEKSVEVKADETAEVEFTNKKKPEPPSGGTTPPTPPTPPAGGIGGMTPPPSGDDSTPPPSDGGGSGTPSKVEKITPKPPKPEEPKKEEPKPEPPKEEPQPPADGIGGTGEPTPPTPTDDPIEGLTGGGAGGGTNDTNVLPGMIPGLSGGGSTAGGPNSAVDPGYVGRLPKTGEGLNSSAYALFFGLVGMSFVIYGAYKRRAKKQ